LDVQWRWGQKTEEAYVVVNVNCVGVMEKALSTKPFLDPLIEPADMIGELNSIKNFPGALLILVLSLLSFVIDHLFQVFCGV